MIIQPSALPDLPRAIIENTPQSVSVRYGQVVANRHDAVYVNIGGAVQPVACLTSYEPMIGDVVAVVRQSATWLILGTLGSPAGRTSAVPNYSFEDGAVGSAPPNWQLVTTTGSPTLLTDAWTRSDFIDGPNVGKLRSTTTATVTCDVVSDLIRVDPNEQWAVSAHLATDSNFRADTACLVSVSAAWYSSSSLGSLVSQNSSGDYAVTRGMKWRQIRSMGTDGWQSPDTAIWLRVKLSFLWIATANDSIYIDRVLARRAQ